MDELTRLYSPSCWVAGKSSEEVMSEFISKTQEAFENLKNNLEIPRSLDISYGSKPNKKIDLWGPKDSKNLLIYFHGGYWAAGSRHDTAPILPCALKSGYTVAAMGYELATKNIGSLPETISDAIQGTQYVLENFGDNFENIIVGGHSAGGHLAIRAVSGSENSKNSNKIKGLLLFSGVYFVEELVETDIGRDISLTASDAKLSTCDFKLIRVPGSINQVQIILGLQESPKLIEQNRELMGDFANTYKIDEFPDDSHFSIITGLLNEHSDVFKTVSRFLNSF
ncbi:unnamed protein product [Caenorhabditis angaria]|uniref:Alpha/beta hydrolase fold-3 domain-containing protein n=1 Tax=Caenorhabditis angaria TaxID=860376 RepID=A0A9P1IME0_9PELO|nr:unnamed protein product [Caenorhabditis angaria]